MTPERDIILHYYTECRNTVTNGPENSKALTKMNHISEA